MIVQIDIDHTIDANPAFFSWLTRALKKEEHTVLIVSSRTNIPDVLETTRKELSEWDIVYDELHLSPPTSQLNLYDLPEGLNPAHHIYIYKILTAKKHKVDVIFDDCSITENLFKTYLPKVLFLKVIMYKDWVDV